MKFIREEWRLQIKKSTLKCVKKIISLYALGSRTKEISDWTEDNLGNRVSTETISSITDRVMPKSNSSSTLI